MKWLYLNLRTFKKGKEALELPLMPVNAFANNNNNSPSLKNQYISSHKGGLICLSTLLQNKNKRLKLFGKQ